MIDHVIVRIGGSTRTHWHAVVYDVSGAEGVPLGPPQGGKLKLYKLAPLDDPAEDPAARCRRAAAVRKAHVGAWRRRRARPHQGGCGGAACPLSSLPLISPLSPLLALDLSLCLRSPLLSAPLLFAPFDLAGPCGLRADARGHLHPGAGAVLPPDLPIPTLARADARVSEGRKEQKMLRGLQVRLPHLGKTPRTLFKNSIF